MHIKTLGLTCGLVLATAVACGDGGSDGGSSTKELKQKAIDRYAEIVHDSYEDLLTRTRALETAVQALVSAPSEANLTAARQAWLSARDVYGQTEAYRFYEGPIDAPETGPEGHINAWPLDEAYIDYVEGAPESGLVNKNDFAITKESIARLNEGAGGNVLESAAFDAEKSISTGWHAIEFLLWGQDLSATGPGARPWQDFLTTAEATHPNGDRRGAYLLAATQLLLDDLKSVEEQWEPNEENYRKAFTTGDQDDALRKILTGIGVLAKGELSSERIDTALKTLDQEDEHSCFSDNTHVDIRTNIVGIQNVWLGRYGDTDGVGIDELVRAVSEGDEKTTTDLIAKAVAEVEAIPAPFDQAIATKDGPGWTAAETAVRTLVGVGDQVVLVGKTLSLGNISADLPQP